MCYSAMVEQHLKSLGLSFKARIDYFLFRELFRERSEGAKIRIPLAMEMQFETMPEIAPLIAGHRNRALEELQRELFAQKRRGAEADRKLSIKITKTAEKEKGIAERKVEQILRRIEKLKTVVERPEDSRIFAMDYAPVMVREKGERVIKPMRYLCRPAGFPETFDRQYPGCYNARRDSLRKFWKKQYLRNHGVLVISSFFENVKRHDFEHRELRSGECEENLVLQFSPRGFDRIVVPCIWDRWARAGHPDLLSFALITDEPPPEIAGAGHDRCPIFLKESNIDRWLNPGACSDREIEEILDDPERPYYENRQIA